MDKKTDRIRINFLEQGIEDYEAHNLENAAKKLRNALKFNPNEDKAKLYLGRIHLEREEYSKAKEYYSQLNTAQAMIELAHVCSLCGESHSDYISKAKSLDENIAQIQEEHGVEFFDNEEYERAINFFSCALLAEEKPTTYLKRSYAYLDKNEFHKAQEDMKKALE